MILPDPGYPTYEAGARLAGLEPVKVPLRAGNGFLLEPGDLPPALLDETLIFWVSYPHNPTGAVAPRDYLERVGRAALAHGFVVASDECYADIWFDEPPLSMLQVQVENVLAIHSCSKRSGMTGYRSGFVAGDADLVAQVKRMRSHPGVASPDFVTAAAVAAWNDDAHVAERREVFRGKRDRLPGLLPGARTLACRARAPPCTSGWRSRPATPRRATRRASSTRPSWSRRARPSGRPARASSG